MSTIKDLFRTTTSLLGLGHGAEIQNATRRRRIKADGKHRRSRTGRPGVVKGQPFGHYTWLRYIWTGKVYRGHTGLAKVAHWLHATKGWRANFKMPTMWIVGRPWHVAGRQDLLPRPKSTRRRVPRFA